MSYRKKHVKYKIHKIKPKKSIFKKLWFWLVLLILIVILVVSYFVLFYSKLQVTNVSVSGNVKVRTQELQQLILNDSRVELLNFGGIKISSSSIFLINLKNAKADVLARLPEIEKLTIKKKFPQTLVVNVIEREPLGAFCDSENICYLIDGNGIIFDLLEVIPRDISIVRQSVIDNGLSLGDMALEQYVTEAIYEIKKSLGDNFKIDLELALVAGLSRLNITTSEKWKAYFDIGENINMDAQITKLNALLSGGLSDAERTNLKYIDLRPKDRAIVCANSTCEGE